MLSEAAIKDWAVKWQTNPLNVAREYVQHVFLSYLYQFGESDRLAFKGGTALRLLYRSPRFSEDLDFTADLRPYHIERMLADTVAKVSKEMIPLSTQESKPTSGGYLALYRCDVQGEKVGIELNISLRKKTPAESILVTTPLVSSYQCMTLPVKSLVKEKCEALLSRKKPRDYYDLYFLLRERLGIEAIVPQKQALMESLEVLRGRTVSQELKMFLPVSHHRLVSNLREALLNELNRL